MILALAVTEDVKERLLAWFMSDALPLHISALILSLALGQSNCLIALLCGIPSLLSCALPN